MRDAMGGSVTLIIIVVFIVIALGYIAFNVNYTKAFRMKDKIISVYDDYNGDCSGAKCKNEIKNYADKIGYSSGAGTGGYITCPSGYSQVDNIYCIDEVENSSQISDARGIKKHYSIATKINLEIPIIKNIFKDMRFFYIFGETKTYTN